MHTLNNFLQSSAPTKNFALPSPLLEQEKNKQWTRWAITVHQKFCSAKGKIVRCNFYAYENLLPNYSREYFAKWKSKRKTPFKKLPLLYGEKFQFCSGVFQNSLHLVYIWFHHNKKYPSIIQRKIQVLLMCFQKNLQIILRKKRFAPFVRRTSSFILFIHQKRKGL